MGKQNQQRRAKRKRQRAQHQRGRSAAASAAGRRPADAGSRGDAAAPPPPPSVESLVVAAAWASERDPATHGRLLARLGEQLPEALAALDRCLLTALEDAWARGWTPADVAQVVGRHRGPVHRRLIARVLVRDGRQRTEQGEALHPRWRSQLAELDDAVQGRAEGPSLAAGLAVLALLGRLVDLPRVLPPPGAAVDPAAGRGLDQRLLGRVRALLAKAESTEFDEEAEALTAKAQELIARHAIDEALLHSPDDVGAPALRRIPVDDPYADAKALLLTEVGTANGCRVVYSADFGWVTAFGYDSALDALELLAASLLAQATAAMARHGARRDAAGRSRTRSFRRSFLLGFASRIGQRLRAATDTQVTAEEQSRLLPVLASREARIEEALATAFPAMVTKTSAVGHAGGFAAGQVAADLADLDATSGTLPKAPSG